MIMGLHVRLTICASKTHQQILENLRKMDGSFRIKEFWLCCLPVAEMAILWKLCFISESISFSFVILSYLSVHLLPFLTNFSFVSERSFPTISASSCCKLLQKVTLMMLLPLKKIAFYNFASPDQGPHQLR